MSIEALQRVLREHAEGFEDITLLERSAAARRRGLRLRRRRIAAGAAVAAIVLPLVGAALLGANPLTRSEGPLPAGKTDRFTFPEGFAGATVIDSTSTSDGEALELRIPRGAGDIEWWVTCHGVSANYSLNVTVDGKDLHGDWGGPPCTPSAPISAELGYPESPTWRLEGAEAARPHVLRAWITTQSDLEVQPPGAVLTAAAYRLAPPERTLAGVGIHEEERYYGEIFTTAHADESSPGDRRLDSSFDSTAFGTSNREYVALQVAGSGLGTSKVTLIVDGKKENDQGDDRGPGPVAFIWGLLPTGPHTVSIKVHGDVPPDARVGVVWRTFTRTEP